MENNVIIVNTLHKKYGTLAAVDGVSFSVKRGEIFAFLGPNGAGKTTTVEMLECLKTPTSGEVTILGFDIRKEERKIKEEIGVLPQNFNALEWLTVQENITYFAKMYPKHVDVSHLIEIFDLQEKKTTLFKRLSGGLKQRVGIAIALVNDPEVVFLDEPTTGLDPRARREVWEAIKELKRRGKTVFLTTHYMDEAYNLADRIAVINRGRIVAEGSPEDLINTYGGGNTLVIRGCKDTAQKLLLETFPSSHLENEDVLVSVVRDNGLANISRAIEVISETGSSCKELYIRKATLEDVFLNLTGEKLAVQEVQ
jgi:ABC-2 type transport system ATP-binding protein